MKKGAVDHNNKSNGWITHIMPWELRGYIYEVSVGAIGAFTNAYYV